MNAYLCDRCGTIIGRKEVRTAVWLKLGETYPMRENQLSGIQHFCPKCDAEIGAFLKGTHVELPT